MDNTQIKNNSVDIPFVILSFMTAFLSAGIFSLVFDYYNIYTINKSFFPVFILLLLFNLLDLLFLKNIYKNNTLYLKLLLHLFGITIVILGLLNRIFKTVDEVHSNTLLFMYITGFYNYKYTTDYKFTKRYKAVLNWLKNFIICFIVTVFFATAILIVYSHFLLSN